MAWADKVAIRPGVVNMCRVNLGIGPGESVLVMTDPPSLADWVRLGREELRLMLERCDLAKLTAEIVAEEYPENRVEFYPYPATPRSGAEPGPEVAKKMAGFRVIIAITNRSLSHTDARVRACQAGGRVASMPGFRAEMFLAGGPMTANYEQVARDCLVVAELLSSSSSVRVVSPGGTDIRFSIAGRTGYADTGLLREAGTFGNLPAGEAYVAPVEGTAEGVLVAVPGWTPGLEIPMRIVFHDGLVVDVEGSDRQADLLRELLGLAAGTPEAEPYLSRRNLAEFGIGLNPQARSVDTVLEAEKIRGTVHLALGDSAHIGGKTFADFHRDYVVPEPSVWLDDLLVIEQGRFVGPLGQLA
jgi:leucyl aminopeptidase (aminopeptidase T)